MGRVFWLGRASVGVKDYELGTRKSDFDPHGGFEDTFFYGFCPEDWEKATRFKLKPGELKKIRINIEVVA